MLSALLVDDDEIVRKVLHRFLTDCGFAVRQVSNGQEAIRYYRRQYAVIDLVLLDLHMPGMDGAETLDVLREIAPKVPVVVMTAYLGDHSIEDLQGRGATQVLEKPFVLDRLAEVLRGAARTKLRA